MFTLADYIKEFGVPKRITVHRPRCRDGVYAVRWTRGMLRDFSRHSWNGKTVQLQDGRILKRGDSLCIH